ADQPTLSSDRNVRCEGNIARESNRTTAGAGQIDGESVIEGRWHGPKDHGRAGHTVVDDDGVNACQRRGIAGEDRIAWSTDREAGIEAAAVGDRVGAGEGDQAGRAANGRLLVELVERQRERRPDLRGGRRGEAILEPLGGQLTAAGLS